MILVVYTMKRGRTAKYDNYEVFDTIAKARERYASLILDENTYIASICAVVESTDYDKTQPAELG
jgi:hypothetical protein